MKIVFRVVRFTNREVLERKIVSHMQTDCFTVYLSELHALHLETQDDLEIRLPVLITKNYVKVYLDKFIQLSINVYENVYVMI